MEEIEIELDASGKPTKAWLERMYTEKHLSHKSIAKLTGINSSNLYYMMQEMGIQFRKPAPRIEKEVLERMYVTENLSSEEIGKRLGISTSRVRYLLQTVYGIPAKQPKPRLVRPTREWLIQKHFEEGVTWKDIREMLGYGDGAFHELLKEYDIPRKQYVPVQELIGKEDLYLLHVVEGLTAVRIAARYGCNHAYVSRLIKYYELDPGRPLVNARRIPPMTKEELEHLYLDEWLTWRAIGKLYEASESTVKRWLNDYGIPRRSPRTVVAQTKRGYRRSSPTSTRENHKFSEETREKILMRDGWKCQMPGCNCTEKWKLEAHHIIPVTHEDCTNDPENGITLCRPCHISIKNKEIQFVALFQNILKTTLLGMQTHYIGETPEVDNPDGSLVEEVFSPEEKHQTR